jgi:hypothetical protein
VLEVGGRQQDVMVEEKGQTAQLLVRVAGKLQTNDRRPSSIITLKPTQLSPSLSRNTKATLMSNQGLASL